jgi:hypothetical protein
MKLVSSTVTPLATLVLIRVGNLCLLQLIFNDC